MLIWFDGISVHSMPSTTDDVSAMRRQIIYSIYGNDTCAKRAPMRSCNPRDYPFCARQARCCCVTVAAVQNDNVVVDCAMQMVDACRSSSGRATCCHTLTHTLTVNAPLQQFNVILIQSFQPDRETAIRSVWVCWYFNTDENRHFAYPQQNSTNNFEDFTVLPHLRSTVQTHVHTLCTYHRSVAIVLV